MTRGALLVCGAALIGAPVLRAQTPSEPRLLLSIFAGYRTGHALWSLNGQPYLALENVNDTLIPVAGQFDTLDLHRSVSPGFAVGVSGTYFPKPSLGFQGEIAFLGMGIESTCTIHLSQPQPINNVNPQLCNSLQGQSITTSTVSFSAGVVGRLAPSKPTYPYVLATAGIVARARSTVEMQGSYTGSNGSPVSTIVVLDTNAANTQFAFTLGAGVALSLGPGYQLRFEGRDVIAGFDRVTGPADPLQQTSNAITPPHGSHFFHNFAFVVALDVVFEQRRGRRY